ncbi:glycosyltransferase family 1 protein [Amycolatopsis rhabdoformis]|uniref:Glycosyltransferase family 1 protein n=1 Tax=Amycolatopsis rhabdoformis TaxID=1448059 RepID=A0ABZ1IGV3_9PSEU|nr:glycosyltransferase family 1 protein [Amycolatopsis rhabdoformis]WSE32948.1 glycosyltransferase family 1 protein [Amycolatopsis rhabdoformis]
MRVIELDHRMTPTQHPGSPLRVLVVTESYPPQVNGVAHTAFRVAEHLSRRGHAPLVVAPTAPIGLRAEQPAEAGLSPVVRVPALSFPGYPDVRMALPTRAVARAIAAHRPDVVHLSSPLLLGAHAVRAALKRQVPIVAVYETDVAAYCASYAPRVPGGSRYVWRRLRGIHGPADRTIVSSSASRRALEAQGIPRVHLLPHGVDSTRFDPRHRDADLRRRLAPNGELLVGYVGRLAPDKHVELLREVCGLPGVRVVVVGDGPNAPSLRAALPDATFLGLRVGDELARIYASLDIFVHTGPFETFGLTIQEAMASGLPVVAPAAGGPLDLVVDGHTGFLVPPLDPAALRDAVCRLVASPAHRAAFGKAGRATAVHCTWEASGDRMIDHYQQVLGERSPLDASHRPAAA